MNLKSTTWLALFAAWFVMLLGDWFLPWFVLPDVVFILWIALLFALNAAPVWPPLLLVGLLMDLSAGVGLGFHALAYGVCALPVLLTMRQMRLASGVEQLVVLLLFSALAAMVKGVLLYVVEGVPMPSGWVLSAGLQILLWPFARAAAEWVMRPYLPREDA